MKKIISFFVVGLLTAQCFADEAEIANYLLEDIAIFKTELNFPTIYTHSPIWTEPLFPSSGIITTNSFVLKKCHGDSTALSPFVFQVFSNETSLAFGYLYECSSFELACDAFILRLVNCNRYPEDIASDYDLLADGVGDFRLVPKPEIITKMGNFHFIRGGKAISLLPNDGVNIRLLPKY